MLKPSVKKVIKIGLPIVLAIFFGWYSFSKVPLSQLTPYFKTANYGWIMLGMCCGLLSHLSRAYRWKYLIEPLGYRLRLPNSIMAVFITYLANYGVPRSGEVLRAGVITNYEGVPFEKGFGTIVAERVADLIVLLGIIGFTLLYEYDFIISIFEKLVSSKNLIYIGVAGIVLLILGFIFIQKSQSFIAVKIKTFVSGLLEGVLSIFKMKHKWAFIAHTLFIWAMYLLMFYITTFAIADLGDVSAGAVLIGFISASFTIAATNGGVAVYPLAVAAAFSLFDIPETPSIAFGWIMWSSQTIMIIIFGVLSFIYLPIYNRKPIN
ncbi:MAG: hypothetical protein BM564_04075 [Bacteroidetes bacterium MedPE-SWsnd-G2]|nr:MAG: hypothetical protein BM564_04075 [Bacteroidetes bacterium MedPE-SWsnd-G2]